MDMSKIKKVIEWDDEEKVNSLLNEGWILLGVFQYSDGDEAFPKYVLGMLKEG